MANEIEYMIDQSIECRNTGSLATGKTHHMQCFISTKERQTSTRFTHSPSSSGASMAIGTRGNRWASLSIVAVAVAVASLRERQFILRR